LRRGGGFSSLGSVIKIPWLFQIYYLYYLFYRQIKADGRDSYSCSSLVPIKFWLIF